MYYMYYMYYYQFIQIPRINYILAIYFVGIRLYYNYVKFIIALITLMPWTVDCNLLNCKCKYGSWSTVEGVV